jgi:hypothetical protein
VVMVMVNFEVRVRARVAVRVSVRLKVRVRITCASDGTEFFLFQSAKSLAGTLISTPSLLLKLMF